LVLASAAASARKNKGHVENCVLERVLHYVTDTNELVRVVTETSTCRCGEEKKGRYINVRKVQGSRKKNQNKKKESIYIAVWL